MPCFYSAFAQSLSAPKRRNSSAGLPAFDLGFLAGDFLAGVPDRDPALDALLEGLFLGDFDADPPFGFDGGLFLAA